MHPQPACAICAIIVLEKFSQVELPDQAFNMLYSNCGGDEIGGDKKDGDEKDGDEKDWGRKGWGRNVGDEKWGAKRGGPSWDH